MSVVLCGVLQYRSQNFSGTSSFLFFKSFTFLWKDHGCTVLWWRVYFRAVSSDLLTAEWCALTATIQWVTGMWHLPESSLCLFWTCFSRSESVCGGNGTFQCFRWSFITERSIWEVKWLSHLYQQMRQHVLKETNQYWITKVATDM